MHVTASANARSRIGRLASMSWGVARQVALSRLMRSSTDDICRPLIHYALFGADSMPRAALSSVVRTDVSTTGLVVIRPPAEVGLVAMLRVWA